MLLLIADSSITYRTRYLTALRVELVLELLLADETNPRSIAFQLSSMEHHIQELPRHRFRRRRTRRTAVDSKSHRSGARLSAGRSCRAKCGRQFGRAGKTDCGPENDAVGCVRRADGPLLEPSGAVQIDVLSLTHALSSHSRHAVSLRAARISMSDRVAPHAPDLRWAALAHVQNPRSSRAGGVRTAQRLLRQRCQHVRGAALA